MKNIESIKIEDNSGDRDCFTIIPNYILNHSTAIAQSLYLQLKRLAGDKGETICSRNYLTNKLGISKKTLLKELDYLIQKGWIEEVNGKQINTTGGPQKVKSYKIIDIWKLNTDFYKGGVKENPPLTKGGVKENPPLTKGGVKEPREGGVKETQNKELKTNKELIYSSETSSLDKHLKNDEIWDYAKYLESLDNHKRRDLQIIALYWKFKRFTFTNKKQAEGELKRGLRAAKELESYEDEKIWQTMEWLAKNANFKWTLESCNKYINENLSKLEALRK